MFPYTAPAGMPEVTRFMIGIGAGTRTTAPTTTYDSRGAGTSTHYYCTSNMSAGCVVKWVDGEGEVDIQRNRAISPMVTDYLHGHYKLRKAYPQQSETILAWNQLAQDFTRAGLSRQLTAASLILYTQAWRVHLSPVLDEADGRTLLGIINCARILTKPNLSPSEQLDWAVIGADIDIIEELKAKGIPLNLIKELYGSW